MLVTCYFCYSPCGYLNPPLIFCFLLGDRNSKWPRNGPPFVEKPFWMPLRTIEDLGPRDRENAGPPTNSATLVSLPSRNSVSFLGVRPTCPLYCSVSPNFSFIVDGAEKHGHCLIISTTSTARRYWAASKTGRASSLRASRISSQAACSTPRTWPTLRCPMTELLRRRCSYAAEPC